MSHCGYVQLLQPAACNRSPDGRIRRCIGENHLSGDSVQSTRHVNGNLAVFWWAFRGGPGPPCGPHPLAAPPPWHSGTVFVLCLLSHGSNPARAIIFYVFTVLFPNQG